MSYKLLSKIEKLLSNKWILNFIVAISFLNIIAFIMLNETVALVYFILIGLIMFYFSKNMSIVLLVPLILVNLFIGTSKSSNHTREGFGDPEPEPKPKPEENGKKPSSPKNTSPPSSSSGNSLIVSPLDNHHTDEHHTNTDHNSNEQTGEPFEVGRNNKNKKGYDIDYASTVEDAYDDLNKILGSDGIKRLTNDTQNLVKQQMKLAESMKSMEPLIAGMGPIMQQAEGMLSSLGGAGNMGNLVKIAEKFSGNLKK
jgi:hypothetical protein